MTTDDILRMAREAGMDRKPADRNCRVDYFDVVIDSELERFAALVSAAERERWQRIAENAQAVTEGCEDEIEHFKVPSHLMAALALALDEGPSAAASIGQQMEK